MTSKVFKGLILLGFTLMFNSSFACDFPAWVAGVDRAYSNGDIISRDGVDYRVVQAPWANSGTSDYYYAPGTGTAWTSAWAIESDPCEDSSGGGSTGGGTGDASGVWNVSGADVSLSSTYSNVGIGITTPTSTLDVHGLTKITASETLGNDVLQLAYPDLVGGRRHYMYFSNRKFTDGTMHSAIGAYEQAPGSTGSAEGPRPLILQPQILGGNLGIGRFTGAPGSKLSVNGDLYTTKNAGIGATPHSSVQLRVKGNKSIGFCVEHDYTSEWGYGIKTIVNNDNTKAIGVVDNATDLDVFRVMGSGLVYATEVKVRLKGDFPDYVFSKDYNLMSLDSLGEFIKSENHLPNVPSAEEIGQDLSLGELTRIQQEKIEELTLYILELKERLEILEKK